MEVKVNTGGLKSFVYRKGEEPKMSLEEKIEMDEAWEKVRIRKKKEKKKKIVFLIVSLVIIIGLAVYFLLK